MFDWTNLGLRKLFLDEKDENNNKARKAQSWKQCEIYNDRQEQYVVEHLRNTFSQETVQEMPIISSINIAKRCVDEKSVVYKQKPSREFSGLSDEQVDGIDLVYRDMAADSKMHWANVAYNLQHQTLGYVVPHMGKLHLKVLKLHHYDVIPMMGNPELADSIIISTFDRSDIMDVSAKRDIKKHSGRGNTYLATNDDRNQKIADESDYQKSLEKYTIWTPLYNFFMNGHGQIMDPESGIFVDNPDFSKLLHPLALAGFEMLPFFDIAGFKDFEYFVRQGQTETDFSVEFNATLSDVATIVRNQGYAQGILKTDMKFIEKLQNMRVGPTKLLILPTDGAENLDSDFSFANPGADIAGSISFLETELSLFLSSRGIDPKKISTSGESTTYASGLERLLSLFEKFDASREDFQVFAKAEQDLFRIVYHWLVALEGTDALDSKYQVRLPQEFDDSMFSIKFNRPENVKTQKEVIDEQTMLLDNALTSRVRAIKEIHGVEEDMALEIIQEIDTEDGIGTEAQERNLLPQRSFPDVQRQGSTGEEDEQGERP